MHLQTVKMLGTLLTFEKYETTNYDECGMRRYSWHMFQWNKNDMKCMKMTTGDNFCEE